MLDSGVKFEEAKSVAQLWETLLNYDAVYSHLHPMDYGPKVLMRIIVHWHSFVAAGSVEGLNTDHQNTLRFFCHFTVESDPILLLSRYKLSLREFVKNPTHLAELMG